jgi:predicted TPR repeat methyltransferase
MPCARISHEPGFGSEYAGVYDDLYKDKDYGEECELIDRLLQRYGNGTLHSVLDLGCGTAVARDCVERNSG